MKTTRKITNANNLEARKNFIKSMATVALGTVILFSHFSILNAEVNDADMKMARVESTVNTDENMPVYIEDYNTAATRVNNRATQAPLFGIVLKLMDVEKYDTI